MSDVDDIDDSIKAQPAASGSKLVKLLSIVLAAVGAIIFMVITSVITFKLMNSGKVQYPSVALSESYSETPSYATSEEMEIRGHTSDRVPITFVVKVVMGYDDGDTLTVAEIAKKKAQLQDLLRVFFSSKQAEELLPSNEEHLKAELLQRINRIFSQGKIKVIFFSEFLIDL